jgi:hypothetical protein
MAKSKVTRTDRERFQAARARGEVRAQHASALVEARYDTAADAVVLSFRGGGSMRIPRGLIPGLELHPTTALKSITLSAVRDALRWPWLDVDVYLPGLVKRAFGKRLFGAGLRRGRGAVG